MATDFTWVFSSWGKFQESSKVRPRTTPNLCVAKRTHVVSVPSYSGVPHQHPAARHDRQLTLQLIESKAKRISTSITYESLRQCAIPSESSASATHFEGWAILATDRGPAPSGEHGGSVTDRVVLRIPGDPDVYGHGSYAPMRHFPSPFTCVDPARRTLLRTTPRLRYNEYRCIEGR